MVRDDLVEDADDIDEDVRVSELLKDRVNVELVRGLLRCFCLVGKFVKVG